MPTIDLNRLYKVRSRERQPVLHGVNVPDAAGAYLRAVRPAQQAQLGISRQNAELDADKWRRRAQGVQAAIRTFSDTYDAVSRARERQAINDERIKTAAEREKNARITKALADAQQHFNRELPTAFQRQYIPGGGDKPVDGPLVGVEQVIADYFSSELFTGLGDDIKEEVRARVGQQTASEIGRATALQSKLQQEDREANVKRLILEKEARVANHFDDLPTWTSSVQELANEVENQLRENSGMYDGEGNLRPGTDVAGLEDRIRLAREAVYRKQNGNRMDWLCSILGQDLDADGEAEKELRAWTMDARQYAGQEDNEGGIQTDWHPTAETQLSDMERDNLSKQMKSALQERDALRARRDSEAQKAIVADVSGLIGKLNPSVNAATEEETRLYTNEAAEEARRKAGTIHDPAKREAALQQIDAAVGIQKFAAWQSEWETALDGYENGTADWSGVRNAMTRIEAMESSAGKAMAAQLLAKDASDRGKAVTDRFVDAMDRTFIDADSGLRSGWYYDENTGQRVIISQEEAIDMFQKWLPFMDREQRAKAWKAFDENRPRLHREDIEALDLWLGANNAKKLFAWDKIEASENGEMVLAPEKEWDSDGVMDINRGFGEVNIDREAARAVWQAALEFRRLKDAGIIKKVGDRYPTMSEWLDEQAASNNTVSNWRTLSVVKRIQASLNAMESMGESAFFNTPKAFADSTAKPEQPVE